MYYHGAGEATLAARSCPVVIKPQNWIVEDAVYALEESHRQRAAARKLIGTASHRFDYGSRSSLSGALLTAIVGPLRSGSLFRTHFVSAFCGSNAQDRSSLRSTTRQYRLRLEREEGTPAGPTEEGIGFTLTEMVNMSERSLRDIGLTSDSLHGDVPRSSFELSEQPSRIGLPLWSLFLAQRR